MVDAPETVGRLMPEMFEKVQERAKTTDEILKPEVKSRVFPSAFRRKTA
jgi:hypothetical protein